MSAICPLDRETCHEAVCREGWCHRQASGKPPRSAAEKLDEFRRHFGHEPDAVMVTVPAANGERTVYIVDPKELDRHGDALRAKLAAKKLTSRDFNVIGGVLFAGPINVIELERASTKESNS